MFYPAYVVGQLRCWSVYVPQVTVQERSSRVGPSPWKN